MPIYQIWRHSESDSIGVANETTCSEIITNNPEIKLLDTFDSFDEAEREAKRIADEQCLEYCNLD